MNSTTALHELQQLLSTPPPNFQGNTNNSAAIAHAALESLRQSGDDRFLFLRTVLELQANNNNIGTNQNNNEELLFHCITGCRHVVLSRWTVMPMRLKQGIRDYLMVLGHTMSRTIRLACYNACASFWKRQWNDDDTKTTQQQQQQQINNDPTMRPPNQDEQSLLDAMMVQNNCQPPQLQTKQQLFEYLEQLLQPGQSLMSCGANLLTTIVGEFSGGKSSSNFRLPLEFHKRAHSSFEKNGWLDRSLHMSMGALSHIVSQITANQDVNEELAVHVVQVNIDIIGWEFGTEAWDMGIPETSAKTLLRPPLAWREVLMRPDFVKAVFHVHKLSVRSRPQLGHCLRQLLLLLSSLSGPMFREMSERKAFATYLLEGTLELLSTSTSSPDSQESSELVDTFSLISRLFANFRLSILSELHAFPLLLQGISSIGKHLLQDNRRECESVGGDLESMEHREWREEILSILLEGVVLLTGDPWLLYSKTEESRKAAQRALAGTLAPLYSDFVMCRTRMARLEEQYIALHETELDEVREEIFAVDLEEEMLSLGNIGRLDLSASLHCLSNLFQSLVPQLKSLWATAATDVSPEAYGLLEESRLVTLNIGYLLTDDNSGETPVIPDTVIIACQDGGISGGDTVTNQVSSAVQVLMQFAEAQASMLAAHPADPRLSPLLAKSFLWFLNRWAPAYILPVDYGASQSSPSSILKVWSSTESVQQVVNFCTTLTSHYQAYWPHERQVQESAATLLKSLAKRCRNLRLCMTASPSFCQLVSFHCLTAGARHSAPPAEIEASLQSKAAGNTMPNMDMIRGYMRLPYRIKANILSAILIACSEYDDVNSKNLFNECLKAIHEAFFSLLQVLSTKQIDPDSVDAREMACLCVELYGGVAQSGEMIAPERISDFITPSLQHLSGLMQFYAKDLAICEALLRLFRDYAEQFIALLDVDSCVTLFQASAELLKSYSAHHCSSRVIVLHAAEEEQNYNDILCAIQLLIQLGAKDFIDVGGNGIDSAQITDMIFFGLQTILPLMTQGLLEFPALCSQYFSLVGFMMEMYPAKVGVIPFDLFNALLDSLLFGMRHHDVVVAKSSLQGIAGIVREHLQNKILDVHLAQSPDLLDKCSQRLLQDVVFQNVVWDRLESVGMALLPLAAVDLNRFATVVQSLTQHVPIEHQQRLAGAFEGLLKPEIMSKVTSGGYEGRQNRIRFKKDFEGFCHEIHSFLVLK